MPRPRYVRHRTFEQARHSRRFKSWLDEQATRLGMTAEELFNNLLVGEGLSFEQIEARQPEPEPDPEPEE